MKLIELCPTAVQETNHYGLHPFQHACSYKRFENVVMKIVEANHAASMEATSFKFHDSLSIKFNATTKAR